MQREPEQREADEGSDGSRNLHHLTFHKPSTGIRQVHVAARNKSGVQRRVVLITHTGYLTIADGEHSGLAVAINLTATDTLHDFLGTGEVSLFRLPVVHTMTCHLMAFVHDTLHHLGGVLGKISCAEERRLDVILLQHIKDAVRSDLRDGHPLLQREVHPMFTGHIELLCVKTQ